MTQKEKIIKALKKVPKRGLSDWEMAQQLYIARPSARISELRQEGYVFEKKICKKDANAPAFYRYILTGEPNE